MSDTDGVVVVDTEELLATLDQIVEEHGADYVYPLSEAGDCVYSDEGKPSCIIGHVIYRLAPQEFAKLATTDLYGLPEGMIEQGFTAGSLSVEEEDKIDPQLNAVALNFKFTPDASHIANTVQILQDGGTPWGEAVQSGREIANLEGLAHVYR